MDQAVLDKTLAPFRPAELMPIDLDVTRRDDGAILIASRIPLAAYNANLPAAFAKRAATSGDKPALAFRKGEAWRYVSYADLKRDMDAATQWLLGAPAGPVMILAPNTAAFAVMTFAAQASGRAVCPVSITYAALGGDFGRLAHVIAKVSPAVVFAEDTRACAAALAHLDLGEAVIVTTNPADLSKPSVAYADLLTTTPTPAVAASIAALNADDRAALMLTSGSTGLPKVVPITFRNLAANSIQCMQTIGKAAGWDNVMLDWLPWHHAAGAFVLRTTLLEGGTLHVDEGKPVPGLFDASVRNLRDVSVRYFNNVPLGYAMLADALEQDAVLRKTFFKDMRLMLYGGAGLSQAVYDRIQAMAVRETGHRIMMTSGYGMTETVSAFMVIHFETDKVGLGLPAPGAMVKLWPVGDRYEVRVKGPHVTTGYLDEPEKTAAAFDEEGFYRTGDLALFHDPSDPAKGLVFAGRAAEEFKLSSGTWVYGGALRDGLLKALSPHVTDLVLCDDGRPYLGVMLWAKPDAPRDELQERLAIFNRSQSGGAARVRRALVLREPPSPNAHEISDKGTINRRAVIDRRSVEVDRLFADDPDAQVMVIS
jgi:feruloyl-CoA synthase